MKASIDAERDKESQRQQAAQLEAMKARMGLAT